MAGVTVVKKQEVSVESFSNAIQRLVPDRVATTLVLGGGDPKATVLGKMDLPGELMLNAHAYTRRRKAESAESRKIFKDDNVAVVAWAGQKPGEPAHLELTKARFWTWFYCNSVMQDAPKFDALSAGAVVITADNKVLVLERSDKVAFGENMLSVPGSFVTKKPKGSEFDLSALLPGAIANNIGACEHGKPAFIGLFRDNYIAKNNVQALYAVKVDMTAAQLKANFQGAMCTEKTARFEFFENTETSLALYVIENFERMLPHTKLGLLAYGFARYGSEWLERIAQEISREKFSAMFAGSPE